MDNNLKFESKKILFRCASLVYFDIAAKKYTNFTIIDIGNLAEIKNDTQTKF